jgi:hypothetical protein
MNRHVFVEYPKRQADASDAPEQPDGLLQFEGMARS